jgi:MFS family permease
LLIAYTNDYLQADDMAAASGGLIFVNGLGAISGPVFVGWAMTNFGPHAFWAFIMVLMGTVATYAAYRMTRRASAYADEENYDAVPYAPILPSATVVAAEVAQEFYVEAAEEMAAEDGSDEGGSVPS